MGATRHRIPIYIRLIWAALLIVIFGASWYGVRLVLRGPVQAVKSNAGEIPIALPPSAELQASDHQQPGRIIYPFSIVPGGIRSVAELKDDMAADPALAAHYAGFDLGRARMALLSRDRFAYMSYRKDNRIYWTKKKLRLAKGEAVITDGTLIIRSRCGNRASDVPASPTSPHEPPVAILDKPQPSFPLPASLSVAVIDLGHVASPGSGPVPNSAGPPSTTVSNNQPPGGGGSGGAIPPIDIFPTGGAPPSGSPSGTPPPVIRPLTPPFTRPVGPPVTPPVTPPVVPVPEPTTLILLLAAAPVFWLLWRKLRKPQSSTE